MAAAHRRCPDFQHLPGHHGSGHAGPAGLGFGPALDRKTQPSELRPDQTSGLRYHRWTHWPAHGIHPPDPCLLHSQGRLRTGSGCHYRRRIVRHVPRHGYRARSVKRLAWRFLVAAPVHNSRLRRLYSVHQTYAHAGRAVQRILPVVGTQWFATHDRLGEHRAFWRWKSSGLHLEAIVGRVRLRGVRTMYFRLPG